MTEKGRIRRSKFTRVMEIRHTQKKRDDCIYVTILYIFILVTTHQRFRTEEYNMKQEEPEAKPKKINPK